MKNNKGFSLVELLVAISILGIVALLIASMMSSGANLFGRLSNQTSLQYNSQLTMAQMQEYLLDANGGIYTTTDADGNSVLYVTNKRANKLYVFECRDGSLYFGENNVESDGVSITYSAGANDLMCRYVEQFAVTLSPDSNNPNNAECATVALSLSRGGKDYQASQVFNLRNTPVFITEAGTLEAIITFVWGVS